MKRKFFVQRLLYINMSTSSKTLTTAANPTYEPQAYSAGGYRTFRDF